MEENNRKGPGIFYAVVGVATLVVAIIGATFAFFSANAESSAITGNTANAGGLTLKVKAIVGTGKDLIPLNVTSGDGDKDKGASQYQTALDNECVDANGNQVCQIYSIYVANKSTTSQIQVRGTLNMTSTAANIHWQLLDVEATGSGADDTIEYVSGSPADFATNYKVTADLGAKPITVGGNTGGSGTDLASHVLAATEGATYYVVVWLEEIGATQEGVDASDGTTQRTYSGTVVFNAVDAQGNESGITATF